MKRKIDESKRVVIPIEFREKLGITSKSKVDIYVEGDSVVIANSDEICQFCKNKIEKDYIEISNKKVCNECAQRISIIYQSVK